MIKEAHEKKKNRLCRELNMEQMNNKIKHSKALDLSRQALQNFELSEISLSNIALKVCRLARLLGEFDYEKAFQLEVSGYSYPNGIPADTFRIAKLANRVSVDKEGKESAYTRSIDQILLEKQSNMEVLKVLADPNINLSYPNQPTDLSGEITDRIHRRQIIQGNQKERKQILSTLQILGKQLSERKAFIYKYIMRKNIELEFSENLYDIFYSNLEFVKKRIVNIVPNEVNKLNSIIENLKSSNKEDWSNAVHSCRRLLESVADAIFPPRKEPLKINGKNIKVGQNNYINRLIAFVSEKQLSSTYSNVVGTNLKFLGDRLDAISKATQKGSHHIFKRKKEAEQYFIYTALVLSDILSLSE